MLPDPRRAGGEVGQRLLPGLRARACRPGNPDYDIRTTPKLVSGVTGECLARTAAALQPIVEHVMQCSSTMVAETAKLHENTFRAVNIALANELALMCDRLGISPWEVIEAASSKPFGFLPHYPGPGLGGDCIPVVPHFLASRLKEYGYSRAAHRRRPRDQRAHAGLRPAAHRGRARRGPAAPINGSRMLLLGLAYKANVHDTRESPSLEIMRQLHRARRGRPLRRPLRGRTSRWTTPTTSRSTTRPRRSRPPTVSCC